MPPELPIIERIAVDIFDAINEIVAGDDYNYTLKAVRPKRVLKASEVFNDLDVLIVQSVEVRGEKSSGSHGIVSPRQQFNIYALAIESDEESDSIDTKCNKIGADIVTKLRKDPRRSELAEETDILSVDTFIFDSTFSGILVRAEVRYNIQENDPTVKS